MSNKLFAERLNRELDNIGAPSHTEERIEVFSKLLKIPKFKAEAFLSGVYLPNSELLEAIAEEFEVNPEWLVGKTEDRHREK